MKECDNSKIHIGSNFIFSVCLLIVTSDSGYVKDSGYVIHTVFGFKMNSEVDFISQHTSCDMQ
jgi:hypothetical protein